MQLVFRDWPMVINAIFSSEENFWNMTAAINEAYAKSGAHIEDIKDKVGKLSLLVGSNPGLSEALIATAWDGIALFVCHLFGQQASTTSTQSHDVL